MQALPSLPVDMAPAAPPAAASATTGQEGLFASSLKAATEQQTTTAAGRPAESPQKQPKNLPGNKPTRASKESHDTGEQADSAALAASLNGSAGAASQQPVPVQPAGMTAVENGLNDARIVVQGNESAVARMLDALTRNGSAALPGQREGQPFMLANTASLEGQPTSAPLPAEGNSVLSSAPLAVAGGETSALPPGSGTASQTGSDTAQQQRPIAFTAVAQHAGTPIMAQAAGQAAAASSTTGAEVQPQEAPSPRANDPLVVQNKYGQIITIHQGNAVEEKAVIPDGFAKATTAATESQRMDVNGNYIRSHLPNDTPDNAGEGSDNRQQGSPAHTRQQDSITQTRQEETATTPDLAKSGQPTFEQTLLQKTQPTLGQEAQPLLFAHQTGSGQQAASSATGHAPSLQLPSGSLVPEGTVVDQMIAHFSINKRLESGTVTLRLSPQELGELRMEIKVEQENIKAHIVAQNPQAQEMIDRHLPRLREALAQQGLHLQQVEVTIASHDHAGNERFQESNAWRQHNPSPGHALSPQEAFSLETDEIDGGSHSAATTLSVLA